jgi:hypothetical protein
MADIRIDVQTYTVDELLKAYGSILDELRRREIVRSSNSPLSDYAELLFCKAFGWKRENNSASGHDATDEHGVRYQIKARRLTRYNSSRQMSAIRNLDKTPLISSLVCWSTTGFRCFVQPSCPSPWCGSDLCTSYTQIAGNSSCATRYGPCPAGAM